MVLILVEVTTAACHSVWSCTTGGGSGRGTGYTRRHGGDSGGDGGCSGGCNGVEAYGYEIVPQMLKRNRYMEYSLDLTVKNLCTCKRARVCVSVAECECLLVH